jgi:transcriptional regulator GlxA family with amidase domain
MNGEGNATTVGIVLFDRAEELDWVGPFEVFTMAREISGKEGPARDLRVVLVSERGGMVEGAKGLRNAVDHDFATAPSLDVVLIPGGIGTRTEMTNPAMLDFLRDRAEQASWVTSVCTGSAVLHAAGLTKGRRITTHWAYLPTLRGDAAGASELLEGVRYVRDGPVVTAAGVSAGIDMALWLVGQLYGVTHARRTQRAMEYDPAPPYAAEV